MPRKPFSEPLSIRQGRLARRLLAGALILLVFTVAAEALLLWLAPEWFSALPPILIVLTLVPIRYQFTRRPKPPLDLGG